MALTLGGAGGLGAPTLGDQLIASQGGSPPCSSLPRSARCSLAPLMSEFQVPLGRALSGQACRPRLQAAGAAAAGTQVGLLLLVQTRLSWDLRSLHRSLFSEKATLLGGWAEGLGRGSPLAPRFLWGTGCLVCGASSHGGGHAPVLGGGPGGAGLFTAAPLVLTRSRGPVGITLQTRFRGPAAGLSDPPGKRWAAVTPEGLMPLLGLTLPPGDHTRGFPAWLRPPSAGLEGTLGGLPPGWAPGRAGPWGSCHALPCPWGGHWGRAHSGPHSLLSPLLVRGDDPPWKQVPAGAPGSRRLSGGGRRTAPGSPWGLRSPEWPEWV